MQRLSHTFFNAERLLDRYHQAARSTSGSEADSSLPEDAEIEFDEDLSHPPALACSPLLAARAAIPTSLSLSERSPSPQHSAASQSTGGGSEEQQEESPRPGEPVASAAAGQYWVQPSAGSPLPSLQQALAPVAAKSGPSSPTAAFADAEVQRQLAEATAATESLYRMLSSTLDDLLLLQEGSRLWREQEQAQQRNEVSEGSSQRWSEQEQAQQEEGNQQRTLGQGAPAAGEAQAQEQQQLQRRSLGRLDGPCSIQQLEGGGGAAQEDMNNSSAKDCCKGGPAQAAEDTGIVEQPLQPSSRCSPPAVAAAPLAEAAAVCAGQVAQEAVDASPPNSAPYGAMLSQAQGSRGAVEPHATATPSSVSAPAAAVAAAADIPPAMPLAAGQDPALGGLVDVAPVRDSTQLPVNSAAAEGGQQQASPCRRSVSMLAAAAPQPKLSAAAGPALVEVGVQVGQAAERCEAASGPSAQHSCAHSCAMCFLKQLAGRHCHLGACQPGAAVGSCPACGACPQLDLAHAACLGAAADVAAAAEQHATAASLQASGVLRMLNSAAERHARQAAERAELLARVHPRWWSREAQGRQVQENAAARRKLEGLAARVQALRP